MAGNSTNDFPFRGAFEVNPTEDIQRLNEKVCAIATDPVKGSAALEKLGASPEVAQRIHTANVDALATAIHCRVPLLELTDACQKLVIADPRRWDLSATASVDVEIRALTKFTLAVAHDLAWRNVTLAQKFFTISRQTAERLAQLSIAHLEMLGHHADGLVQLRDRAEQHVWDLLLIGDRCVGQKALEVARRAVQLSMIRRQELSDVVTAEE